MTLSIFWTVGMAASLLYACYSGTLPLLTSAVTDGICGAVSFCTGTGAMMVFWCGFFAVMEDAGIAEALSRGLRPLLGRLFPNAAKDPAAFAPLTANVTANLLGLGNAATPMGIRAAQAIARLPNGHGELAALVVMNTASIQLLPTTVISLRASMGSAAPADILPCVLVSSALSVTAGLIAVKLIFRP